MDTMQYRPVSPDLNDLSIYELMGNEAMKSGDRNESVRWYMKGLSKARELRNEEKARLFSQLIITLL